MTASDHNPILWTEIEFDAAVRRHNQLMRQRRLKEARSLLKRISISVIAELKRSTLKLRPHAIRVSQ